MFLLQERGRIDTNKLLRRKEIQIGSLTINGTSGDSKANLSTWLEGETLPEKQLLYSNPKMN